MSFVAETGYDGVEIAPFTLAPHVTDVPASERTRLRQEAAEAGIEISGIHWVLVGTEGMHMTSPDESVRRRTAQYFCDLVDFCADLGGESIIVGSPHQRNLDDDTPLEIGLDRAREVFRASLKKAEDKGVTVCFEPLAPSETNFINTAEEAITFVKTMDSEAFKIILDVKAMCSMGRPIPEIIRQSKNDFAYFHANDANLKGPGFGETDFGPIGEALREIQYEGYVSVEVFNFDEGAEMIAQKSLECLKTNLES